MNAELKRKSFHSELRPLSGGAWLRDRRKPKADHWMPHDCPEREPGREWWVPLRRDLGQITEAIERSRDLLITYDEDGQPVCSKETWERAVRFLSGYARRLWEKFGVKVAAPEILPGGDGSIDLLWSQPHYELLLNIPSDPTKPATYYGDDRAGHFSKGTVTSLDNKGLIWLAMRK